VSAVSQLLKHPRQAIVIVYIGKLFVKVVLAAHHFSVDESGFDGSNAVQAPTGGGQGQKQIVFDAGRGLKVIDI